MLEKTNMTVDRNKQGLKRTLFNETRIFFFHTIIFQNKSKL